MALVSIKMSLAIVSMDMQSMYGFRHVLIKTEHDKLTSLLTSDISTICTGNLYLTMLRVGGDISVEGCSIWKKNNALFTCIICTGAFNRWASYCG